MKNGFVKVACVTPKIRVADPDYNAAELIRLCKDAAHRGAMIAVFPELCLTGYTCSDLFYSEALLEGALSALREELARVRRVSRPVPEMQ